MLPPGGAGGARGAKGGQGGAADPGDPRDPADPGDPGLAETVRFDLAQARPLTLAYPHPPTPHP